MFSENNFIGEFSLGFFARFLAGVHDAALRSCVIVRAANVQAGVLTVVLVLLGRMRWRGDGWLKMCVQKC